MTKRILLVVLLAGLMGLLVRTAGAADAAPARVAGQLSKIDGKNFTITGETDGKDTVITCNDATQYRQDGSKDPVTFDTFKVGQKVRAYYRAADNVAVTVILAAATATPPSDTKAIRLVGNITKIDGKALTITGDADGKDLVLTVTDATQYRQDGSTDKLTFDSFKVGDHVRVYYASKDNTIGDLILTKAP